MDSFKNITSTPLKLGIIICHRYHTCAGGKCLKSLKLRYGAFARYEGQEVELVGFTTCGGCPGGNIEYAPREMKKNGATIIHFATGMIVGYPPCPRISQFKRFIEKKYELEVIVGTHPIPENYYQMHQKLGTWETWKEGKSEKWEEFIVPTLCDHSMRKSYD